MFQGCQHLRAALGNMHHKLRMSYGCHEFQRLSILLKKLLNIDTNLDEATNRRMYLTPSFSFSKVVVPPGITIPNRRRVDVERENVPAIGSFPIEYEDGWAMEHEMGVEFPYAFCPTSLGSILHHRFSMSLMPKLEDTLMLDESFFIYIRGRDVDLVVTPNLEELVDTCKAKNLQLEAVLLFFYMIGRQLSVEADNVPSNRMAFGTISANKGLIVGIRSFPFGARGELLVLGSVSKSNRNRKCERSEPLIFWSFT